MLLFSISSGVAVTLEILPQTKVKTSQTQYNKILQNNTSSIGGYLQSLNGAEASLSGYIKYLVSAKASTAALTVATTVMKTVLMAGAAVVISLVVQQISKWVHAQEEARQKAVELTNAYKDQQTSLDKQIDKYQELKETLDKSNLSTDETRSIKEQLLEIQNSLIESYGTEASNIDLVNGKYKEQLGLLAALSKEKASEYIAENRSAFEDAKKELNKIRTYKIGSLFSYNSRKGMSDDQRQLYNYIKSYSDLFEIRELYDTSTLFNDGYIPTLYIKATAEEAKDVIDQFYYDIEQYIKDNNLQLDYNSLQINLSKVSSNITANEKLKEYRNIYDEFIKAQIVYSDTLRPLYQQSIQAVEDYNKALSSGEGVEEARANLDAIQQSVQEAAKELEGSQEIFDDIYAEINENAVAAYNLNQSFANDDIVQKYAEQLRGLYDYDLMNIRFDNDNLEQGEEAFKGLIDALGLTEDKTQMVIDKLVELGYVQSETLDREFADKTPTLLSKWQSSLYSSDQTYSDLIKDWESQTKQLQSVLSDIRSGDTAITAADIVSQFPDLQPYIDQYENLALAVDTFMRDSYEELLDKFGDTSNIEGFSYQLEYLQGVLNEGLGGANNIDHLVAAYEELIGILDQVNNDHTFTEEEIANLINKYDALKDAVIITTDGYKLEDDALIDLINNYISLSNTAISNQVELTRTTIEGIEARVKAWGMEIEALKTVAKIYNATGGSEDAVGQYIYDNYGTNLTSATPAIIAAATEYTAASNQLDGLLEQLNNSYTTGSKYKSGSSSSSAAESFTDTLEKELAALDKSMEAGYINFNDYITARLGLIEEYYRKGRIAADEYYSYLEKHYDQQLSAMDRVVNAVTRRIDTEIDGLEKQKSSIESAYNTQIDSLEKQKTLLQEANKERERQADLQKALYELERAQQQKTKMVFTEDGGMRYVTDDTAIRDASKNVDDARLEIQIAELDRSISKLEEARDRETAAIDETISKLKEYKDSWSDLTSAYEEEQDNLLAAQILGQEWEEDILNGRLDTLDAFKNEYISIQQAMADAAWQSANEQIKAAQEAQKGALGTTSGGTPIADTVTSSGPHTSLGNKSNIKFVPFHEYASGTDNAKKGINLVGEDGTEAYFDNYGHIALITEPTLIPMEGGEVVKNESATRKLLNPNNLAAVDTGSLAGIDDSDPIASGRLRPVQSGDRTWELQQSLIAYLAKMGSDINALLAPVNAIQRDTEQIAGANINTNQIHNANQMQQVTIGDIHVTCPGVTSQEIMNQVGEALNRQLGGIALDALQESTKR